MRNVLVAAAMAVLSASALTAQTCNPRVDSAQPCYTQFDVKPALKNQAAVIQSLRQNYPAALKLDSVGGKVGMWVLVDDSGKVRNQVIHQSSGSEDFDKAALRVASVMEFTPATLQSQQVWAWIQLPVVFCPRCRKQADVK